MAFPSSTDSFAGFVSTDTLAHDNHASQHNQEQTAIVAIENKLGTGAATPTGTTALVGNGTGTSTWGQVALSSMVSGVLPTTNGGTGQSSLSALPLPSPNITGTVTGGASYSSPILTTPTIADFTNAQHTHTNAASGGVLNSSALNNPYKFSVYRNAALSPVADTIIVFDTKLFDTGSNFSTSTGLFTAPIAGFYCFSGMIYTAAATTFYDLALYKNGSLWKYFGGSNVSANAVMANGFEFMQLSANDTIGLVAHSSSNVALATGGNNQNYFTGFLVSAT